MSAVSGRTWLNIGLLVLVAGLVALVVYQPGIQPPEAPVTLTSLTPAQVDTIYIERKNRDGNITLKKDQGQWRMTEPLALPADAATIEQVLRLADTRSFRHYPITEVDPTKLRLASPQVQLHLNDVEIAFGDKDAMESRRYARIGDTVHLINDDDYYILLAQLTQFADKSLLPDDKQAIEIILPDAHLVRQDDKQWNLKTAVAELSPTAVDVLAEEWRNAEAETVNLYEQRSSRGTVIVHLEGAENPLQFEIVQRKGQFILARPDLGIQYGFPEDIGDRLLELAPEEVPAEDSNPNQDSHEKALPIPAQS